MIHDNVEVEVSIVVREAGAYPYKTLAGSKYCVAGSMCYADMAMAITEAVGITKDACRNDLGKLEYIERNLGESQIVD